ncbi:hypothetical protein D3C80_1740020 [compost metagenome]
MCGHYLRGRAAATEMEVHFIQLHFFNQAVEFFRQLPLGNPAVVLRLQFRSHFSAQFAKQGAPLAFCLMALHFRVFLLLMAAGDPRSDVRQCLIVFVVGSASVTQGVQFIGDVFR